MYLKQIQLPSFDINQNEWKQFYEIFSKTLNSNLSERVFKAYLFSQTPVCIDVSFIYNQQNKLVGFIETSFYRNNFNGNKITIGRGAAGILPNEGVKLPSFELCKKYMKYKLNHPFEQVFITGYMANPILYSMMCNYTHRVYPKFGIAKNKKIEDLKIAIITSNNLLQHLKDEYLVKLHFKVTLDEYFISKIENSKNNKHIAYYLSLNPKYGSDYGVFTIIPLDWLNISASIIKAIFFSIKKVLQRKIFKPSLVDKQPTLFTPN